VVPDQWNISFQRHSAPRGRVRQLCEFAGHRLPVGDNINPAVFQPGATTANVNQRARCSAESAAGSVLRQHHRIETVGTSVYDALLLSLNHRASKGLTLTGNWTFSRCITDLINYEPGMAGFALSKPGDVAYDRGSCGGGDCKHVVNGTAVYQLPAFAKGAIGAGHQHWQVAGIVRAQSGDHFNVTTGADSALTARRISAESILSDPYRKREIRAESGAFQAPTGAPTATCPINGFVGPGAFNIDMGITRSFRTGGTREIQFRRSCSIC
jgi:hypothetical protein